jgi:hypothetical protein
MDFKNLVVDFRKDRREGTPGRRGQRCFPRQRRETRLGYRIGEAYFSGVRPMDTGGNVIDDIIWRRTEANKPPLSNKDMFNLLETKVAPYWVKLEKVVWSRYAGCSCPCSPGYVLYGRIDSAARSAAGIKYSDKWYFSPQEHEFQVWVCTKEYEKEQALKAAAYKIEDARKKAEALIGAGI